MQVQPTDISLLKISYDNDGASAVVDSSERSGNLSFCYQEVDFNFAFRSSLSKDSQFEVFVSRILFVA